MQFVLVHGAWQGAWCWKPLASLLMQRGHTVSCPDLPGHGSNLFPLSQVTYDTYYQSLEQELIRHEEAVVLVAHSMAGILAAPLLDQYPERIAHLYLIGAFVPQRGQSLIDLAVSGGPSAIPDLLISDEKQGTQSLDLTKVKMALYHDCPSEVADWAIRQLQPQSTLPFITPVNWSDSGTTRHKRTYIFCDEDRDVHPITQSNILEQYPCRVIHMKTGHFPFLSQPQQLSEILVKPFEQAL